MPFEFREERLASNPVALLQSRRLAPRQEAHLAEQLLERGVALPGHYLGHLGLDAERGLERHGVVGCVVEASGTGWVDRLRARPSKTWKSRPGLPFDALELDGMLLAMLAARGEELVHLLPEARCFELTDQLQAAIEGESMTVAAALAVLDCTSGGAAPEFAGCLSLVQRAATGDDALVGVEAAAAKLQAFARECGRGSLCLVARGDSEARALAEAGFDRVWEVGDLGELGGLLDQRGLLDGLAKLERIDRAALLNIEGLLRQMGREDWMVARGLDLARRLVAASDEVGFGRDVSFAARRAVGRHVLGPLRLEAAMGEVVEASSAVVERLEGGAAGVTHEERAAAAVDLSAAYFVVYRFDEMAAVMGSVRAAMDGDPGAYSPGVRARVLGNLGRALAVWEGESGWRACFLEAIELLGETVPGELALSRGFYVGALLGAGCLDEAGAQLDLAEGELLRTGYRDNVARWFQAFNRADLARRRGLLWEQPEMESDQVLRPGQFGRPLGYYFQATARQPGRSDLDAERRFRKAALAFGAGISRADSGLRWLALLMEQGAAERAGDQAGWDAGRARLADFLAMPWAQHLAAWHGGFVRELPESVDSGGLARLALETIFDNEPYFLGLRGR